MKITKTQLRQIIREEVSKEISYKRTDIQKFYDIVEDGLIERPNETTFGSDRIYLWFSERFSGWHIDFEANIRTDGRRVYLEIQDEPRKYTDPVEAAEAINKRRELEMELNDPGEM
tara:strand:+ start:119 stop:466 length:348 start_codon:yes stop_codon:yes gene_type:complete